MKTTKHILALCIALLMLSACTQKEQEKQARNPNELTHDTPPDTLQSSHTGKYVPKSLRNVSDYENVLTYGEVDKLMTMIVNFEKKTSNQIGILTVSSIGDYENMKAFAVDVFNTWGMGQKDKDNGLLITFSKTLHTAQITTGYGTEKILTDKICAKALDEKMIPAFKKGKIYDGLKNGLTELMHIWENKQ